MLHHDQFILAIPEDSLLAESASVSPAQLRACVFVLPEQNFGTFEVGRRGVFNRSWARGQDLGRGTGLCFARGRCRDSAAHAQRLRFISRRGL
jgi:hypothetical protein